MLKKAMVLSQIVLEYDLAGLNAFGVWFGGGSKWIQIFAKEGVTTPNISQNETQYVSFFAW